MNSQMEFSGSLATNLIKKVQVSPLSWRIRQWTRPDFLIGLLNSKLARLFSKITGIPTLIGELRVTLIKADGRRVDYGLVSAKVVTTAFVNFMVDQLQAETSVWGDFKYHDSGVGTTAAVIGDTDIETTDGESRVAGTQVEGASANIYKSVGTITYTSSLAITEQGLFSASTGATLMDRHVFTAINVVNTDSIEFTYELTATAGG